MNKHPSQITPIPAREPEQARDATSRARAVGVAGIAVGGLSGLAGFIQAVGGLPEIVKALSAFFAHGWPATIALVATSSWLIHWQWFKESRAERAASEARQAERDQHLSRTQNELLKQSEREDLAHQRQEVAAREQLAAMREQNELLREMLARLAEPTARSPRPTGPQTAPPRPPRNG